MAEQHHLEAQVAELRVSLNSFAEHTSANIEKLVEAVSEQGAALRREIEHTTTTTHKRIDEVQRGLKPPTGLLLTAAIGAITLMVTIFLSTVGMGAAVAVFALDSTVTPISQGLLHEEDKRNVLAETVRDNHTLAISLGNDLAAVHQTITSLNGDVTELDSRVDHLREDLHPLLELAPRLDERIVATHNELERLRDELRSVLSTRFTGENGRDLERRFEEKIDRLASQFAELTSSLAAVQSRVEAQCAERDREAMRGTP